MLDPHAMFRAAFHDEFGGKIQKPHGEVLRVEEFIDKAQRQRLFFSFFERHEIFIVLDDHVVQRKSIARGAGNVAEKFFESYSSTVRRRRRFCAVLRRSRW